MHPEHRQDTKKLRLVVSECRYDVSVLVCTLSTALKWRTRVRSTKRHVKATTFFTKEERGWKLRLRNDGPSMWCWS